MAPGAVITAPTLCTENFFFLNDILVQREKRQYILTLQKKRFWRSSKGINIRSLRVVKMATEQRLMAHIQFQFCYRVTRLIKIFVYKLRNFIQLHWVKIRVVVLGPRVGPGKVEDGRFDLWSSCLRQGLTMKGACFPSTKREMSVGRLERLGSRRVVGFFFRSGHPPPALLHDLVKGIQLLVNGRQNAEAQTNASDVETFLACVGGRNACRAENRHQRLVRSSGQRDAVLKTRSTEV